MTPVTEIEDILEEVDMILMMCVDPIIEVDGCVNKETNPLLVNEGANILVLGTSSIFNEKDDISYSSKIEELYKYLYKE